MGVMLATDATSHAVTYIGANVYPESRVPSTLLAESTELALIVISAHTHSTHNDCHFTTKQTKQNRSHTSPMCFFEIPGKKS